MRDSRDDYRDNRDQDREPRGLHNHHHGQNADRGNYTVDSSFNRGYGVSDGTHHADDASFNSNADYRMMSRQGRFQPGGATYSGDNYTRQNSSDDNMYGMTYVPDDNRNSSRHYDARADYSNSNYDDLREQGRSRERGGMADERFGHDVRRGGHREDDNWARNSRSDHESYRRYEQDNRMYDDDYTTGFAGRNHTEGRDHFGEDRYNSNLEMWNQRGNRRPQGNSDRDRNKR